MAQVHTLTVQDMIWIHLQLTKETYPFDFAALEEATYYQYGYGRSLDVPKQAAKFLMGFAEKQPFPICNEAAAFVGFVAFLHLNGYKFKPTDAGASDWLKSGFGQPSKIDEAQGMIIHDDHDGDEHAPDVKGSVQYALDHYPKTIRRLLHGELVSVGS